MTQRSRINFKPENVVFDKKGKKAIAKLIDFGFAKILDNQNSVLQTPVGTLEYCGMWPVIYH